MLKRNILQTLKGKLERIKAKLQIIRSFLLGVKLNNTDTIMAHPFTNKKLNETRKFTCKINKKILLWNVNDEPHNPIQKSQWYSWVCDYETSSMKIHNILVRGREKFHQMVVGGYKFKLKRCELLHTSIINIQWVVV